MTLVQDVAEASTTTADPTAAMVKSTRRTAQESNDDDLFAQLEAELEDDDTTARERDEGIQEMMR